MKARHPVGGKTNRNSWELIHHRLVKSTLHGGSGGTRFRAGNLVRSFEVDQLEYLCQYRRGGTLDSPRASPVPLGAAAIGCTVRFRQRLAPAQFAFEAASKVHFKDLTNSKKICPVLSQKKLDTQFLKTNQRPTFYDPIT